METRLYFDKYLNVWQEETDAIFESYDNEIELSYFTEDVKPKKSLGKRIATHVGKLLAKCLEFISVVIEKITGRKPETKAQQVLLQERKISLSKQCRWDPKFMTRIKNAKSTEELRKIETDIEKGKLIKNIAQTVTLASLITGGALLLKKRAKKIEDLERELRDEKSLRRGEKIGNKRAEEFDRMYADLRVKDQRFRDEKKKQRSRRFTTKERRVSYKSSCCSNESRNRSCTGNPRAHH